MPGRTANKHSHAAALDHERSEYQVMLDSISEGIIGIDDAGIVTYINRAALDMLGGSESEVLGHNFHQLFHHSKQDGSPYPAEECPISLAKGRADNILEMEDLFWRKDGTPLPVEVAVAATPELGQKTSKLVSFHDISQLKENQKALLHAFNDLNAINIQLNDAYNQLLQSEKMASIGQLAAGIAHEINTPIGFVQSNLASLEIYVKSMLDLIEKYDFLEKAEAIAVDRLAEVREAKKAMDYAFVREDLPSLVEESRNGIERVRKIVKGLKDFSCEGSSDSWTLADIRQCMEDALSVVQTEIEKKAEIKKEYGEMPEVYCLPSQINYVFMNLLLNAAQAIEIRGEIGIRMGSRGTTVWIEITDTGVGIPAENISKIFDPFFTTKSIGQGTGMGLSIAYGIVKQHRGWIDVTSTQGQGTTVLVVLPARLEVREVNDAE